MKRFWTSARAVAVAGGWAIKLDERPVRTPLRAPLEVPGRALAEAIAGEWDKVGERVDPRDLRLTGLANAAIDRVAPDPAAFAGTICAYAQSDLACYRASSPESLVAAQAEHWDRLLGWARRRFDVDFATTCGLVHVAQPDSTVASLTNAVRSLDPFRLAGLSQMVTIGGSLVAALAFLDGAMNVAEAWAAVTVDERWQAGRWGEDGEAQKALEARRTDFFAAARFLELIDAEGGAP